VLAHAMLPSPKHIKKSLKYLDIGIKLEMLIFDMSSTLYWGSLAELATFIFAFLLFVSNAREMLGFFWFVLHSVRAAFGFLILRKLPASHTIIESIVVSESEERVDFEDIVKHLVKTG